MRMSPKMSLLAACFWSLLGVVSLLTGASRINDLHAAGQHVHPMRYGNLVFWVLVIGFWIVLGVKSFKRLQAERKVL